MHKENLFLRQPGSEGEVEGRGVRLIRIKQITSDEALSNQLLRISI